MRRFWFGYDGTWEGFGVFGAQLRRHESLEVRIQLEIVGSCHGFVCQVEIHALEVVLNNDTRLRVMFQT